MRKIRRIISRFFEFMLPLVEKLAYLHYFNQPFSCEPKSKLKTFEKLEKSAEKNTYSVEDVDLLEKNTGYSINKEWLNKLATKTQIVIKKNELNYAHGRVLYSALRSYLANPQKNKLSINIVETGTARGFSALCMAKALADSGLNGKICTIDVLPHYKKMFWNSVADHNEGSQTRNNLLNDWNDLMERYIIFIQGFARQILPKIALTRINFAFLDGSHTYEDVIFEFNSITKYQKEGDIIIFDDYNEKDFPGIVKVINQITNENKYNIKIVKNKKTLRNYAIAKKII